MVAHEISLCWKVAFEWIPQVREEIAFTVNKEGKSRQMNKTLNPSVWHVHETMMRLMWLELSEGGGKQQGMSSNNGDPGH